MATGPIRLRVLGSKPQCTAAMLEIKKDNFAEGGQKRRKIRETSQSLPTHKKG
jgi:hypothetical protein